MKGSLTVLKLATFLVLTGCEQQQPSSNNITARADDPPWSYDVQTDGMRKTRTWFALNEASNQAQLDFPYQGGTTAKIQLEQNEKDSPENQQPTLIIHNGQLDCDGNLCDIGLKFDDGEVFTSRGTKTDCGSDQCVNLNITEDTDHFGTKKYIGFHKRLRASKKLVLEVPIYKFGRYQFEFNTSGLVWPQPDAPKTGEGTSIANGAR